MNVIRYNVNSTDACNIGYQYEHNASKVVFSGYVMKDPANEMYFKFMGRTAASRYLIPIVDMTLDITHLLTKNAGTFKCQLEERTAEGDFVGETPVFQVHVGTSIKSNADYEIVDDRLPTLYTKYNEMYNIIHRTNEQAVGNELERQANWETLRTEVRAAIADIDGSLDSYKAETTAELQGNVNEYKTATTAELQSDLESYERTTSELVWGRFQTYADSFAGLYERRFSDYQREADMNITNEVLAAKEGLQADIDGKFSSTKAVYDLEIGAVVSDLERRRDNGDFNGKDGYTPVKGKDYRDGIDGTDYVITEADYQAIGDKVEAEYTPELTNVRESLNQKADKTELADTQGELALANRKINALTNILEGRELAFEKMDFESAKIAVPSGAVADTLMRIGGKSLVWNQLVETQNQPENSNQYRGMFAYNIQITNGHKYIASFIQPSGCAVYRQNRVGVTTGFNIYPAPTSDTRITFTFNATATINDSNISGMVSKQETTEMAYKLRDCLVIDITQLFGTGNEPTTVDDPRIKIIEQYALAHPEYNAGEIISSQTDALEVRGKNIIPPNLIVRGMLGEGDAIRANPTGDRYVTVDYIEVVPNASYSWYTDKSGLFVFQYDANKNQIGKIDVNKGTLITMPSNCRYVRITTWLAYGTVNNGDICLCRGAVNSYVPYSLRTIPTNLPVLRSAGEAYDYIETNVTFPNMKAVDLGSLNWIKTSLDNVFYANMPSYKFESNVIGIVEGYGYVGTGTNATITVGSADKTIALYYANGQSYREVYIHDSECTNASEMKAKLNGVILHYEATEGGEDYTTNLLHERVGAVDLNNLNFTWWAGESEYYYDLVGRAKGSVNLLAENYSVIATNSNMPNNTICGNANTSHIYVKVDGAQASKPTGQLYYELANERIKELPDIPTIEAINVEADGEIRFVDHSEMALPIPTTHEWIVRNEEV